VTEMKERGRQDVRGVVRTVEDHRDPVNKWKRGCVDWAQYGFGDVCCY